MAVSDTMGTEFRNPAIVPYRTVLRSPRATAWRWRGSFMVGKPKIPEGSPSPWRNHRKSGYYDHGRTAGGAGPPAIL